MQTNTKTDVATLLFDGECPLCRRAAAWIDAHATPGTVESLPCLSEKRLQRFPEISTQACQRAALLILPDGRILEGAAALPHILQRLRLRRWRCLAAAFRLPGASLLAPLAYAWMARHRHALSALLKPQPTQQDASRRANCGRRR